MNDSEFRGRLDALLTGPRHEMDSHELCELFLAGNPSQRAELRTRVNPEDGTWRVPPIAKLASGEPHPIPAETRIRDVLVWQAIEGGERDFRDNLMSIALAYDAAVRLGVDAEQLFDRVADIAPPNAARLLRSFPRRRPHDRSLEAFRYRAVPTAHGVRYEAMDW